MTDRIRILKFLNHFWIGGTERQFVYVANGLDSQRFRVEVACFRREGALLESLDPGIPVHTYSLHGTLYHWRSFRSQLQMMKDVRRNRFDIVHTYGWYPNVFGVPASRLARHPIVIASIRDAGAYMTPAKIRALKIACGLADCVLANSYAGREWLIEQGVRPGKIEVIHNGITVRPRVERTGMSPFRKEFGIAEDATVCACIGRVVTGKGIDYFMRAARIVAERRPDVRFVMVGAHSTEAENYGSELMQLARELKMDHRIIFTGQRKDVTEILRDVDILVHPSLTEGLSNVILEAMAAGIPVVATRVGGNPELVENERTGFLVPVKDAGEIAAAIYKLLDSPPFARALGESARERVIKEFAIDRMLSKTETLYGKLMSDLMVRAGCLTRSPKPSRAR